MLRFTLSTILVILFSVCRAGVEVQAHYTIDLRHTEFRFHSTAGQANLYTVGGKGDPIHNPYDDVIAITPFAATDTSALRKFAVEMIGRYKAQGGMDIPSYTAKATTIKGNYAYEISFSGTFKGKPFSGYEVVTGNKKASLLFIADTYSRQDELMKQIIAIAKTLNPK